MRIRARRKTSVVLSALTVSAALVGVSVATSTSAHAAEKSTTIPSSVEISSTAGNPDDTGLAKGAVKHVWLIILENKSYDATFTGLNHNSYLWQTLPQQGVLLKNYYGTGHFSQDNYESLVSGQGPEPDTQADCDTSYKDFGGNKTIVGGSSVNKGQVVSTNGANQPDGANGCVYPSDTPTLFNQLDAAGKTWKGYAQDLKGATNPTPSAPTDVPTGPVTGRDDAVCGGPGTSAANPTTNPTATNNPSAYGVTSFTGAQPNDQYVAKHFPFPWFHSLISGTSTVASTTDTSSAGGATTVPVGGGSDCDSNHIANLDSSGNGLYQDLQSEATTPNFSWITPDNCSDAHDAVCKGNNLSGAFDSSGNPKTTIGADPENSEPTNYTGGLYASDLFLKWYIPMIEQSPAFKDGGLIDVTFDEANPPFANSSFSDASSFKPGSDIGGGRDYSTPGGADDQPNAKTYLKSDLAGQSVGGKNVAKEPTGPNTPLKTDANGNQLFPGPGDNAFIDRPPTCSAGSTTVPVGCVPGIIRGGSGSTPGTAAETLVGSGTSTVSDTAALATDMGRQVTSATPGFPTQPVYVGQVMHQMAFAATNTSAATTGGFQLVDGNGTPVTLPAGSYAATFAARTLTSDPLFDATDPTPGGGDTGSVLISPYIRPGTSTTTFYNHYSWLRTMEDLFGVSSGADTTALPASTTTKGTSGSVSGGIDGLGHLGFAGQKNLDVFGPDVFNNPDGSTPSPALPEAPFAVGLPLVALAAIGGGTYVVRRRRRPTPAA